MKKGIIVTVVLIQLIGIFFIGKQIFQKRDVKGVSVNPIVRYEIVSSPSGKLEGFYEPQIGDIKRDLSFLGEDYNYSVIYHINNDRLNQLNDYQVEKSKGVFRIITLGASFTYGANVNTKDNYPMQLQEMLDKSCGEKKFEVLNLGMGGYDLEYSVERLRVRGMKYDPDLVVWLITDDNFRTIKDISEDSLKQLSEEALVNMQKARIKETFSIYGRPIVFVGSKNLAWQHKNLLKRITSIEPHTHLFLETPDIYKKKAFFPDNHPNEKGYKLIAESIFDYLKDEKVIQCN